MPQVLIPIIRNVYPNIIAHSITGVQPIAGTVGRIFRIRHEYSDIVFSKKKYKFSRAKWFEARLNLDNYYDVHNWCATHFGKHDKRPDAWSRWWHKYESTVLIRDEEDYILFVLRWGKTY